MSKKGGVRSGAGRPAGTGRYGEPTQAVRVPQSLLPVVAGLLAGRRGDALPADAWQVHVGTPCPLPRYGHRVRAGFPSPADDHLDRALDLNELLIAHPAATFLVTVEGESMTGLGIHPGDLLVVDRAITPQSGQIVVAAVNGELTVKTLELRGSTAKLVAAHPDFPPIAISAELDLVIWGVVTGVVRTLKP